MYLEPAGPEAVLAAAALASPDPTAPNPPPAPKGKWFDQSLDFRDPEGDALTRAALAEIAAVEERKRKRRPVDEANHYRLVRKILANGFRCQFHRRPSLVAYSRKTAGYKAGSSGRAMARTVDLMEAAGLLGTRLGEWRGTASVYRISRRLHAIAQRCGIIQSCLTHRLPSERLVRLRECNSRTDCLFEPTDDTLRWTAQIEAYNAFLAQQDIALPLSDEEAAKWVRHCTKDQPSLYRPELFRTDLHRIFNNRSFEQGGRLYGGWWQNTPKRLRWKIVINGQPTVELDYSGCAIRMLYHERGLAYDDDPYQLEAVAAHETEKGLPPGHFRPAVKAITQALINATDGDEPERIALPDGLSFRPGFRRSDIRQMIEAKHIPIADAFGTGAGLHLQRKDSDLALAIITSLKERAIVALPIHDSFVTTIDKRDDLLETMDSEYRIMFGFHPTIK